MTALSDDSALKLVAAIDRLTQAIEAIPRDIIAHQVIQPQSYIAGMGVSYPSGVRDGIPYGPNYTSFGTCGSDPGAPYQLAPAGSPAARVCPALLAPNRPTTPD